MLDKIESNRKGIIGMEGHYLWLDQNQDNARIKKTECWEIIRICPELDRIYLKKVGRKVMTEKVLTEVEEGCVIILKKDFELM